MSSNKDGCILKSMDLTTAFAHCMPGSRKREMKSVLPKNDPHLLDTIMNVHIGESFYKFDISCLDASFLDKFSRKFDEIKKRNKTIKYKLMFQNKKMLEKNYFVRQNKKSKQHIIEKKCKFQVHNAQVQEGIRHIVHKLLPQEIIGNDKNNKTILKAWSNFLKTAKTEPFNLLNLVNSLNIDTMTWTKSIKNERLKYIVIAKLIKWLFQYLIALVEKVFYLTHIRGEIVFIFIEDWRKQTGDHIKLMSQKRPVLQLIGPINSNTEIQSRLSFLPKKDGLRPITIHRFTDDENQTLKLLNALLKHLHQHQPKKKSFNKNFVHILKRYKSANKKMFIVCCDIADAYGSILQSKLFEIVQRMFEVLPKSIKFKTEVTRNKKFIRVITAETNTSFNGPQRCETADKHILLQALKNHIFQTKVICNGMLYNVNRGLSQGFTLSSILCQIYYTSMDFKYIDNLTKHGDIFRYMDDYLFITDKLDAAERFLHTVKKGFQEYNCHFKDSKLQHNLDQNGSEKIQYLGWKIDSKSLEVESSFDSNSARHSMYYSNLTTRTLPYKLKNLMALKINKMILNKETNSRQKIFHNVALIFQRQAERCFALLSSLYNSHQIKVRIDVIKKGNSFVLRKIERLIGWGHDESRKFGRKLKFILWKIFYGIFRRRDDIFADLTLAFKELMTKFKRKKNLASLVKKKNM